MSAAQSLGTHQGPRGVGVTGYGFALMTAWRTSSAAWLAFRATSDAAGLSCDQAVFELVEAGFLVYGERPRNWFVTAKGHALLDTVAS